MQGTWRAITRNPWTLFWAQRRMAAIGAGAGLALAVALCLILPATWEARMIASPTAHGAIADYPAMIPASDSPTLQYLSHQAATLTDADFAVYETLLTSPRVAARLQNDASIKPRLNDICADCATDAGALAGWLEANIHVRPLGATAMRRITVQMHGSALAPLILQAVHRAADDTIRGDTRARTEQRIAYLRDQLGQVANPDHRDALVALLKEQERTRMMVGIDHDFAAQAIDPPSLVPHRIFPDPYVMLPILTLLGAMAGAGFGLTRLTTTGTLRRTLRVANRNTRPDATRDAENIRARG